MCGQWTLHRSCLVSLQASANGPEGISLRIRFKCTFQNVLSLPKLFSTNLFVLEDLLQNSAAFALHLLAVLLLHSPSIRMDVAEYEMELGVAAALVRAEHDGVGGLVREVAQVEVLRAGEQLDVSTAAVETILESHLERLYI